MDTETSNFPTGSVVALAAIAAIGAGITYLLAGEAPFLEQGKAIAATEWGRATLADLAAGFLLALGWILYREDKLVRAGLWTIAVLALGNLAVALYVLRAALRSEGRAERFFMGEARVPPTAVGEQPR